MENWTKEYAISAISNGIYNLQDIFEIIDDNFYFRKADRIKEMIELNRMEQLNQQNLSQENLDAFYKSEIRIPNRIKI